MPAYFQELTSQRALRGGLGEADGSASRSVSPEINPDRNRGWAYPCQEIPWPSAQPLGIFCPTARRHVSAPQPTAGRWTRGGCPAPSWRELRPPCRRTFAAL